jgi:hypothetical protein
MEPFFASSAIALVLAIVACALAIELYRSHKIACQALRGMDIRDKEIVAIGARATAAESNAAASRAERDFARTSCDFWKTSTESWRGEALKQLAFATDQNERFAKLMTATAVQAAPREREDDDFGDPPTVAESDRRVAEERRAHADARRAIGVADDEMPPRPRAVRDDDDDDDEDLRDDIAED